MIQISSRIQRPLFCFVFILLTICIIATLLSRSFPLIEKVIVLIIYLAIVVFFIIGLNKYHEVFYDKEKDVFILKSSLFNRKSLIHAKDILKISKKGKIRNSNRFDNAYCLYFKNNNDEIKVLFSAPIIRDLSKYIQPYIT